MTPLLTISKSDFIFVIMYIERALGPTLRDALAAFPAVLLTGPRQSGKTTLLRHEYGDRFGYVTFDDPLERDFARTDPLGFLNRFADRPVILDEIQYLPELLPYLKMRIDEGSTLPGQGLGRWLLSGSQQFLDSALVTTLTRQPDGAAALAGPMGGALFEGWVVAEAIKAFAARGRKPDLLPHTGCRRALSWFVRLRTG